MEQTSDHGSGYEGHKPTQGKAQLIRKEPTGAGQFIGRDLDDRNAADRRRASQSGLHDPKDRGERRHARKASPVLARGVAFPG